MPENNPEAYRNPMAALRKAKTIGPDPLMENFLMGEMPLDPSGL